MRTLLPVLALLGCVAAAAPTAYPAECRGQLLSTNVIENDAVVAVIDPTNGNLTASIPIPEGDDSTTGTLAYHNGYFVVQLYPRPYSGSSKIVVFSAKTRRVVKVFNVENDVGCMAYGFPGRSVGTFYCATGGMSGPTVGVLKFSTKTGTSTLVGTYGPYNVINNNMALFDDRTNVFYVRLSQQSDYRAAFVGLDVKTGNMTTHAAVPSFASGAGPMANDPLTGLVYFLSYNQSGMALARVDLPTGAASTIGPVVADSAFNQGAAGAVVSGVDRCPLFFSTSYCGSNPTISCLTGFDLTSGEAVVEVPSVARGLGYSLAYVPYGTIPV